MTVSDSRGTFKFDGLAPGPSAVRVRRSGFRPETVIVSIAPSHPAMVSLKLEAIAAALSPVMVRATSVKREARLVGFYERMEQVRRTTPTGSSSSTMTRPRLRPATSRSGP
jgi:hypothetical protein